MVAASSSVPNSASCPPDGCAAATPPGSRKTVVRSATSSARGRFRCALTRIPPVRRTVTDRYVTEPAQAAHSGVLDGDDHLGPRVLLLQVPDRGRHLAQRVRAVDGRGD